MRCIERVVIGLMNDAFRSTPSNPTAWFPATPRAWCHCWSHCCTGVCDSLSGQRLRSDTVEQVCRHAECRAGPCCHFCMCTTALQGLFGWLAILVMRRLVPADYGLHRPRRQELSGARYRLGRGVRRVLMTLVDYAPQLWSRTVPHLDYPLLTRKTWSAGCSSKEYLSGRLKRFRFAHCL